MIVNIAPRNLNCRYGWICLRSMCLLIHL